MDGRAELKNKTLLPGPNHFHEDHHNLNIISSSFSVYLHWPLCIIWGISYMPLAGPLTLLPGSPFLLASSMPVSRGSYPQLLFFFSHTTFTWMSTSEASPSRCAGLGSSLCLSCIDLQLTEFTWIHPLIYSFTWILIAYLLV